MGFIGEEEEDTKKADNLWTILLGPNY